MQKFKRKLEITNASGIQFTGFNLQEISEFIPDVFIEIHGIINALKGGEFLWNKEGLEMRSFQVTHLKFETWKDNIQTLNVGDWLLIDQLKRILVFNKEYIKKNFEQL